MDKLLLRPNEAAEVLGLGRSKTYDLIARGVIPAVRIGKSIRVPIEALRDWVASQTPHEESAGKG
jgi:prophage regulatory protein